MKLPIEEGWNALRIFCDLRSLRLAPATLETQKFWAGRLAPQIEFDADREPRELLQKFSLASLREQGSRFHRQGIEALDFPTLSFDRFEALHERVLDVTGWTLKRCDGELRSPDFFSSLARKEFPCNFRLRSREELFNGQFPDVWHEIVGHVSALANPEFSDFCVEVGKLYGSQSLSSKQATRRQNLERLLWILLEYGLIRENGQTKILGAAFASSFLAMERLRRRTIAVEAFDPERALDSGLFEDGISPRRDRKLRVVFFEIENLQSAFRQLSMS
jgi:phenylalanine-4-hydroxylase